jgi:hypothetical protein
MPNTVMIDPDGLSSCFAEQGIARFGKRVLLP